MSKEEVNNNDELVKVKQSLKKIQVEVEIAKKHHEVCLELLKKGATKGGKTMDSNKTSECIEEERQLINKIDNVMKEIDKKIK